MNHTPLALLSALAVLTGCGDSGMPRPIEAALDRVKGVVFSDPLPEKSPEIAVDNHGLAKLLALAEGGNPKAQHFVAAAYQMGIGTPKNFDQATRWALRAANQGVASSQYLIGSIRADAAGMSNLLEVEGNLVRAYMWLSLASAQGHGVARADLERLQTSMEPEWVQRAQLMASSWRPCHQATCWDIEPRPPPSASCAEQPTSIKCLSSRK